MKGKDATDEISGLNDLELPVNEGLVRVPDMFSINVYPYDLPPPGDRRTLVIMTAR